MLDANEIAQQARRSTVKDARRVVRHGPDLTRRVGSWHRLQAGWRLDDDTLQEGATKAPAWPGFTREMFARLYSGDRTKALEDVRAEHKIAEKLHSVLDELPEFQRLAQRCRGDAYATQAATKGIASKVVEAIPQHKHDAEKERRVLEFLTEEWGGKGEPPPEVAEAMRRYEQALAEAEALADSMDESAIRQGVRGAAEAVNEQLDAEESAASALGWGQEEFSKEGSENAAAIKARLSDLLQSQRKLQEIVDLAGRMRNILRAIRETMPAHGAGELTDIEQGSALDRLLPSEKVMLRHPAYRLLLARKLYENGALQYKLESREKEGRGPIVVCIDDSGSMAGSREVWAKAVALSFLELARKEGRPFAYCTFSTVVTTEFVEPIGSKTSPDQLLEVLSRFNGGGTDFSEPLRWAMDQIDKEETLAKADVVFVSDGYSRADNDIIRRVKSSDARCWGVGIGEASTGTSQGAMGDFCDEVWKISEIVDAQDGTVSEIMGKVL